MVIVMIFHVFSLEASDFLPHDDDADDDDVDGDVDDDDLNDDDDDYDVSINENVHHHYHHDHHHNDDDCVLSDVVDNFQSVDGDDDDDFDYSQDEVKDIFHYFYFSIFFCDLTYPYPTLPIFPFYYFTTSFTCT